MPVPKEELEGSPKINFTRKSGTATQVFRILPQYLEAYAREVFPPPFIAGNRIIIPPSASFPGKLWMKAQDIAMEPFTPDGMLGQNDVPNYYPDGFKVTVNYSTPEFDSESGNSDGPGDVPLFVRHKISASGEFLTWPALSLQWDQPSDPTLINNNTQLAQPRDYAVTDDMMASVVIPNIEHSLQWNFCLFPPWSAIRQCIGKVNAFPFAGAPPETLLFLGCEAEREYTTEGFRMWTVDYKFAEKNTNGGGQTNAWGWNHFLRPTGQSAGQFQRLRKRLPAGVTYLSEDGNGDTIKVKSSAGFPRGGAFRIRVGPPSTGTEHTVFTTSGSTEWTITPGVAGIAANTTITQIFRTEGNISATATTLNVTGTNPFPQWGQFMVRMDNEYMAITAINGVYYALRGVQGSAAVAHSGDVEMVPGNVYDLADFRALFLSGLITG